MCDGFYTENSGNEWKKVETKPLPIAQLQMHYDYYSGTHTALIKNDYVFSFFFIDGMRLIYVFVFEYLWFYLVPLKLLLCEKKQKTFPKKGTK